VLTGSAIGSNLGQRLNLDNKTLMLLVGCGAAAAIAGIFKAPIAGLVFTLEVLMVDLTMASLMPILISSVTATCFTYLFLGEKSLFNFTLSDAWRIDTIPADILLGVSCAVISLYFIRMMNFTEGIYSRMKDKPYAKLALGGITLSLLIFLFPSLYGEGYNSINILLNGKNISDWQSIMNNSMFYGSEKMLIVYIALVLLTKVFATSATNGGGGVGGTFAPSLFIGAYGGFLFARLWNTAGFGVSISESNFTMLGMAGVIAGVMHAPLTGIFLIAEITGGYDLFMPLIIVSIVSVMATGIFEPHSIYATRLARQGRLVTHHTDSAVLTLMNLNSVIEKQYNAVGEDRPLGKLVKTISRSDSGFIPVTDTGGTLLGEVDITKIRHIMFRTELYQRFAVSQVMTPPPAVLTENDPMQDVMRAFEETNAIYLPVTDMERHLIGYISRVRLFDTYRKMVADMSSE
jgi:CIC family chloride channel protein